MAVPKKKKSYTKCNKKYTAWRTKKNFLSAYTFCNVCFNLNRKPGLYLKTNMECLLCLKKDIL
jgi:ribosomal protein L32